MRVAHRLALGFSLAGAASCGGDSLDLSQIQVSPGQPRPDAERPSGPRRPPLADAGPVPIPVAARWPEAEKASPALDAPSLWGWTRRAAASGDPREAERLTELVRATKDRRLHEEVWNAVWYQIENPAGPNSDVQAALEEATLLGRAVEAATGDRSYGTRIREWTLATDRDAIRRGWVESRLSEARRAWEEGGNAEAARARLSAARTAAGRLEDGTELLGALDELSRALPPEQAPRDQR